MKKYFIAAALLLSVVVINATTSNDRTKQWSDLVYAAPARCDTVPSDTSRKDSTSFGLLSYNALDTLPKDTTKKDTMSLNSLAYRIIRDTVPSDTSRKDSTFQYFAIAR